MAELQPTISDVDDLNDNEISRSKEQPEVLLSNPVSADATPTSVAALTLFEDGGTETEALLPSKALTAEYVVESTTAVAAESTSEDTVEDADSPAIIVHSNEGLMDQNKKSFKTNVNEKRSTLMAMAQLMEDQRRRSGRKESAARLVHVFVQ